ncbi:MAG: hypothetical protein NPIRA02_23340 [Nitrospirales bacterium]|nr:MAG: hypothetical protein NPIRA02_23340 [Nitrospirales bacterium]
MSSIQGSQFYSPLPVILSQILKTRYSRFSYAESAGRRTESGFPDSQSPAGHPGEHNLYCSPEFKPPVHVVRAEIGAGSGNLTLDADAPRCTTASTE